ncbi:CwfJ C-terminus 1-domain-containing protein-like protein [Lipomyces arxii]|uniref:CwfJ C-terminus 1-domain-containing protein-like protein n=1 Tax=Lipomyces arxii TaxID=56418 RepID=UPI0034CFCA97
MSAHSHRHKRHKRDESDEEGEWVENESEKRDSWMTESVDLELQSGDRYQKRTVLPERKVRNEKDSYFVHSRDSRDSQDAKDKTKSEGENIVKGNLDTTRESVRETVRESVRMDETTLNRMKASLLKAKLRHTPNASGLEKEYNDALASTLKHKPDTVEVLSLMDTRGVKQSSDDMTIQEMVAEEKRTRGGRSNDIDKIRRDKHYKDSLDYMDDNAEKLAARISRNEIDLKNIAVDKVHKLNAVLDSCPLCSSESAPPTAPVIVSGTRVYLTLPTMPQLAPGAASIVPVTHRKCTLECDDDEWDEIRNFMKCLARMYHSQHRGVLFYENAAVTHRHASIEAVPVPYDVASTAPAYFRTAMLSSDEEWATHDKVIDTLAKAKTLGKAAFRRSLVKELPYFHVWFSLDGGYGHVVEDSARWPRGDLFAREIIGGMLELEPQVYKRQGKWEQGVDPRVKGFKQMWDDYDWTKQLLDDPGVY